VCDALIEMRDGVTDVIYRLTVVPERIFDRSHVSPCFGEDEVRASDERAPRCRYDATLI
jgi:hypothetical protein